MSHILVYDDNFTLININTSEAEETFNAAGEVKPKSDVVERRAAAEQYMRLAVRCSVSCTRSHAAAY